MAHIDQIRLAAAIVIVSILSVFMTGDRGGGNNNVFHLPTLEALWLEPQFAHDAFVQSMRRYASEFWMLFTGVTDDSNVLTLLFAWMIICRLLFFSGIFMMAPPLGCRPPRGQAIFLSLYQRAAACLSACRRPAREA